MAIQLLKNCNPLLGLYADPATIFGKLRIATDNVGINPSYGWELFTQVRKDGTRRLKVWRADRIFNASQETQVALEAELKKAYGDAYMYAYFIPCGPWNGATKSFCIILDNSKM